MAISAPYQELCTQFYDLDKPVAPADALAYYLHHAQESSGPILEPMCGTGRFMIPLLQRGFHVTGFDTSKAMIGALRAKCIAEGIEPDVQVASFETAQLQGKYGLIMVPGGSFCLLKNGAEMLQALECMRDHLLPNGVLLLEVDTPNATHDPEKEWCGRWVNLPDGAKIVLSTLTRFQSMTSIETTLCRYELWRANQIERVEVEELILTLLPLAEYERLLEKAGFVVRKRLVPYTRHSADDYSPTLLFECQL